MTQKKKTQSKESQPQTIVSQSQLLRILKAREQLQNELDRRMSLPIVKDIESKGATAERVKSEEELEKGIDEIEAE